VGDEYERALVAGMIAEELILPNGLIGRQRTVRISLDVIDHIAAGHPDEIIFCLYHLSDVLARPEYIGNRPTSGSGRVEFVRQVGPSRRLVLVAVKFLDSQDEAWVSTAHYTNERSLTRRMRAGTMQKVGRGP
jgi:hypothetical protein